MILCFDAHERAITRHNNQLQMRGKTIGLAVVTLSRSNFLSLCKVPTTKKFLSCSFSSTKLSSNNKQIMESRNSVEMIDQDRLEKLRKHEFQAKKLTLAEDVRTLIDQSIHFGTLSTNSLQFPGFPTGSLVGFALDTIGKPFFVFSSMSAHTKDIKADGRASLTVTSKDFKGAADGRAVLIGQIIPMLESEVIEARDIYLQKHVGAYWVDFGDFSYFKMDTIHAIRYVGGFAMAGTVTPADYYAAKPDPCASYSHEVIAHMNDEHSEALVSMVNYTLGIPCSEAMMTGLDRLGFTVKAKLDIGGGTYHKVRLSFPVPVTERKQVREYMVAMTDAASS